MLSPLLIVLILLLGICIVVGGILALKLPAFLTLILAAIAVASCTPSDAVRQSIVDREELLLVESEQDTPADWLRFQLGPKQKLAVGEIIEYVPRGESDSIGQLIVEETEKVTKENRTRIVVTAKWLNEAELVTEGVFLARSAWKSAKGTASGTIGSRIAGGFGTTCGKIGILIAMASIIGKCLLDSGAADRIVRTTLKWFGETAAPAAFVVSGFLLGIPVFFDTVFYLMVPLGKAMRMRTGRNYLLYCLTIVAGGTMAHSLVPPTPGPLLVAEQLGVDIGLMILVGCGVGLVTVIYGGLHATVVNRIWTLELRESDDLSLEDLTKITERSDAELPPLWLALLPILLPVILIGGETVSRNISGLSPTTIFWLKTFGDKNLALVISAAIAIFMLIRQKVSDRGELGAALQSALASGGMIILITAAGGAFGTALQQTGVATVISDLPTKSPMVILALAFLITTAIRTAQGSATVAMITAVGILAGFSDPAMLGFHPVWLAVAIGCGSKPVAWMNDSGFWVITRLSGMTEAEGLKFVTPMTLMMGIVGLLTTMLGATLFPLL